MNIRTSLRSALAATILVAMAGYASTAALAQEKSLYERLGGYMAIAAVVKDFVGNVAADERINAFFAHTNIPLLRIHLVELVCQASGGPCTYEGGSMKEVHAGMGVTQADFNALVEDLVTTLNKFQVPQQEQQELLGMLGPMASDIVERP